MNDKPICPYYGKNDDLCDVGCDYISPHDVDMIIHFCNREYQACRRYQQLVARPDTQQASIAQQY